MHPAVFDAIALATADNVATVLRSVSAGELLRIRWGDAILNLAAAETVPMCHKLALTAIAAGAPILKYGTTIGVATSDIALGAHVHTHNLQSQRTRHAPG